MYYLKILKRTLNYSLDERIDKRPYYFDLFIVLKFGFNSGCYL